MKEERQSAVEAILKSGNIPAGMELFTAGNESQLQTIMRWIDESDIYVLLLGGRYGSLEKSSGLRYTEVEYDYAVSQKKPYFAVVITEDSIKKKIENFGADVIEKEEPKKLKEFRVKVLSNISSFYSESKDIKLAIHETLQDFKDRYDFSGWVSGKNVEQVETLLDENRVLRLKIEEFLKGNNSEIKTNELKPAQASDELNEFKELQEMFSIMKIKTNRLDVGDEKEYSILELLIRYKNQLITGYNNKMGMTDMAKFFFFNIFPKLAIHDLAENIPIQGVQYRLFKLNKKGLKFLAYIDKQIYKSKK